MELLPLTGCAVDLERGVVRTDAGEERGLTTLELGLLRYLAARPGVDVGRDELAREVWRGAGAGRAVDFTVRRLRVKLGEPRRPVHVLTAHGHGYRFVPLAGPTVVAAPVEEVVVALATGALSLARRQFVRDGQSHALSHLEARVLEELVPSLGKPVLRDTLIARVWGRGRHDHTLDATIARLRAKLEPDPAHPVALVTTRGEGPCLVGATARTERHVPEVPATFLDRPERDLARAFLADPGLVTLLGTAGIGKTRLALRIAAEWTGDHRGAEAWFCDLTRVGSEDGFVARVATTLGTEATTDAERVGRLLAGRPPGTLVVLDNLEQLTGCAGVVDGWLRAAPAIRLLGTSRISMGVSGERVVQLHPLARETGVTLFRARAQRAPAEDEVVGAIVERLDGLPLAIELAAALTERMPASTVLERLGARLDLLVHRPEGATSQHSTLRRAIDWSWHLLDPDQQQLLAAVSVFAGSFDADDASALVGRDAAGPLAALVDRSLVVAEGGYRLLASIREFARERLVLAGLLADRVERHADRVLARAEPLAADLDGHWGADANAQLAELRDDLLAALDATTRADVRGRLACIVGARGFSDEGAPTRDRLCRALDRGAGSLEGAVWVRVAACSRSLHAFDRAEAELGRAAALPLDDRTGLELLVARVRLALSHRPVQVAKMELEALEAAVAAMPPSEERLRGRVAAAVLATQTTSFGEDLAGWEEALAAGDRLVGEVGDAELQTLMLRSRARYHLEVGEEEAGLEVVERALQVARESGRRLDVLKALETRAVLEYHAGRFAGMEQTLDRHAALARRWGIDRGSYPDAIRALAAVERFELDRAEALVVGRPDGHSLQTTVWANVLLLRGRGDDAVRVLVDSGSGDGVLHACALAVAGRSDDALRQLESMLALFDPRVGGIAREAALTRAVIAQECARGTADEPAVRAAAAGVLASPGRMALCDDGVWRERNGNVAKARLLLEARLACG